MKACLFNLTIVVVLYIWIFPLAAQEPIVIKFPHVAAENTPKGQMALKFRELVAERFGGKVVVKVYPDGRLYDDEQAIETMLLGDVQLAAPSVSKLAPYCERMQIYDLPFLFENREAVERFQQTLEGRYLLHSLAAKGVIGLGYLNDGFKLLSASRALVAPADAAGLRFRIQQSRVLSEQFRVLNAVPLKKPFSQISLLLQDKAVDGQENTWVNIQSRRLFTDQPYITELHHGIVSFLVVTSAGFWQSLDESLRQDLHTALLEALAYGNSLVEAYEKSARHAVAASPDTRIIKLDAVQKSQWRKAWQPVWGKFEDEIGKDLINIALRSH